MRQNKEKQSAIDSIYMDRTLIAQIDDLIEP